MLKLPKPQPFCCTHRLSIGRHSLPFLSLFYQIKTFRPQVMSYATMFKGIILELSHTLTKNIVTQMLRKMMPNHFSAIVVIGHAKLVYCNLLLFR